MIKLAECEDRYLYEIKSRNLTIGAFRQDTGGFIGIREKFGSRYLFEEFHWEKDQNMGTVHPVKKLDVRVPDDIYLGEFLPGVWCTAHDRECRFLREEGAESYLAPGKWHHVDDGTLLWILDDLPVAKINQELFGLMEAASAYVDMRKASMSSDRFWLALCAALDVDVSTDMDHILEAADQLRAAADISDQSLAVVSAEASLMAPVVEAAKAWFASDHDPFKARKLEADLADAVEEYLQATKREQVDSSD